MESIPLDDEKQGQNIERLKLESYIKHLEKRIYYLESERKILEKHVLELKNELMLLRKELDDLREPALLTGVITDVLDDNNEKIIVDTYNGQNYVIYTSNNIKNEILTPGMNVGINQHRYIAMEILSQSFDPLVQDMELIDLKPNVNYDDIGGLNEQIREVREAVELPLLRPELFIKVGIEPPKGILLEGPSGTGKTLLARAVANKTNSTFIKIIASELVQKFIGEGSRMVREIFNLAREKAPTIIFIDEIDAIGSERIMDGTSGDREVERTLMQLLSELDGFNNRGDVKFIAATNRGDVLDRALLRSGRFDRKINFPLPNVEAREAILKIHMKKLNIEQDINLKRIVNTTEGATGADIKAICVEAGMFAIRKSKDRISQDDFEHAIKKVLKKTSSNDADSEIFS